MEEYYCILWRIFLHISNKLLIYFLISLEWWKVTWNLSLALVRNRLSHWSHGNGWLKFTSSENWLTFTRSALISTCLNAYARGLQEKPSMRMNFRIDCTQKFSSWGHSRLNTIFRHWITFQKLTGMNGLHVFPKTSIGVKSSVTLIAWERISHIYVFWKLIPRFLRSPFSITQMNELVLLERELECECFSTLIAHEWSSLGIGFGCIVAGYFSFQN